MTKKSSKRKNTKGKSKGKKVARKFPWLKLVIALVIIIAGFLYFLLKYGELDIARDLLKGYIPKGEVEVNLYFADPHSDYLVAEKRKIENAFSQKQKISKTIEVLIKGPKGKLIQTIPPTTIVKNVRIDNNYVVWIDFSHHLSNDHPGGSSSEIMTVYSIVNTVLLNFKEAKKVRLLIDGMEIKTLAGHIDCSEPFTADKSFIK